MLCFIKYFDYFPLSFDNFLTLCALPLHYLDVMNLFAICHLDVSVMTNELIYLVFLKVYYVKDDCFVMLLC